ncbi:uncharacterized protein YpmS [Oikeobacillus pervagus]|uniref:Uncharacterized protein YpmS n=1 Tax=Oikeobacillus pervagus TaxID=1325931 RepID=A0AAJ1SXF5_9BACI|nr:YpmS family protein [Oikeobacillus pervagus]MDQ0214429.1 uncharacterized protein YpmS [Oikeobacillus pervagus]
MKTKWKRSFFLLLGMNLFILAMIIILIFLPTKNDPLPVDVANQGDDPVQFHVNTNREDLNKIINAYIKKENQKSPIDYQVILKDNVELHGDVKVFSEDVDFKLTFEPKALNNGDLVLKQKGISLGQLKLPVSYILKFARDSYNPPDWIRIMPNDKMIYVSLKKMELKSDMKIRADHFNLKEDDIRFTLLIPTEK